MLTMKMNIKMRAFTRLFIAIDEQTSTNAKVNAIVEYLKSAPDADKLWVIAILTGNTPKRILKTSDLKYWAAACARLPYWIIEESHHIVGDLAETIAHVLPEPLGNDEYTLTETIHWLQSLSLYSIEEKQAMIAERWMHMPYNERLVFNKLITGNFRMGVSRQLLVRALAIYLQQDEKMIAHKLMGKWNPMDETIEGLFSGELGMRRDYLPYPFYLAYPLENDIEQMGSIDDWFLEKKYDGIRGQIIVRNGSLYIWSRVEELMTDKFPEFNALLGRLPDGTVIDGEILPWKNERPLPFQIMQTRISRKKLSARSLAEAPLVMICYDLLEYQYEDIRDKSLHFRRGILEKILTDLSMSSLLKLSPLMEFENWQEAKIFRTNARKHYCEGLMIKRKDSVYETGRKKGYWWKWKAMPMSIDAVLIYAQSGHGRRANLFTDYTFAIWDEDTLVPCAKAYSGLTDKEIASLDYWVKKHTVEKFGPVRSVVPELVFEIAFEGINISKRHKSGVALRFPRILRWRRDKLAKDANTKDDLIQLLEYTMNE
jgi:DNA ligase-1